MSFAITLATTSTAIAERKEKSVHEPWQIVCVAAPEDRNRLRDIPEELCYAYVFLVDGFRSADGTEGTILVTWTGVLGVGGVPKRLLTLLPGDSAHRPPVGEASIGDVKVDLEYLKSKTRGGVAGEACADYGCPVLGDLTQAAWDTLRNTGHIDYWLPFPDEEGTVYHILAGNLEQTLREKKSPSHLSPPTNSLPRYQAFVARVDSRIAEFLKTHFDILAR